MKVKKKVIICIFATRANAAHKVTITKKGNNMTTPSTYQLGYPPLKYSVVPFAQALPRDPTSSDIMDPKAGGAYPVSSIWINTSNDGVWILAGFVSGAANWVGISVSVTGNVVGPASSTDNAIARFSLTTGKIIKNSLGILSDAGVLTGLTQLGIGIAPTALLGLAAGTAAPGTSPLKFAAGVNLTTQEAGAVEYDGTSMYFSDSVPTRYAMVTRVTSGVQTNNAIATWSGLAGVYRLFNNPGITIASGVMTFAANSGPVMTAGTRKGTAAFNAGATATATILTAAVATDSVICITRVNNPTGQGTQFVTITAGVSFAVTSSVANDAATFNWGIVG